MDFPFEEISGWIDEPSDPCSTLLGDQHADVVVIGAGEGPDAKVVVVASRTPSLHGVSSDHANALRHGRPHRPASSKAMSRSPRRRQTTS